MSKKRITLRVDIDEIAVVGPINRWEHLIETYKFLANLYPEHENAWLEAADWISNAIAYAKRPHNEGLND